MAKIVIRVSRQIMNISGMGKAFLWIAKKVLTIGGQTISEIATTYSPPLGLLLKSVLSGVLVTEGSSGNIPGSTKKELALLALQSSMPIVQDMFEATGKPIHNPALFAEGVEKVQDGLVDILNATGNLTKA